MLHQQNCKSELCMSQGPGSNDLLIPYNNINTHLSIISSQDHQFETSILGKKLIKNHTRSDRQGIHSMVSIIYIRTILHSTFFLDFLVK